MCNKKVISFPTQINYMHSHYFWQDLIDSVLVLVRLSKAVINLKENNYQTFRVYQLEMKLC
jgi:hypothetical protein